MSITKLKTLGEWQTRWKDSAPGDGKGSIRGRVITGMLTGDEPAGDTSDVSQDPCAGRTR
jgi:hypothetical protein